MFCVFVLSLLFFFFYFVLSRASTGLRISKITQIFFWKRDQKWLRNSACRRNVTGIAPNFDIFEAMAQKLLSKWLELFFCGNDWEMYHNFFRVAEIFCVLVPFLDIIILFLQIFWKNAQKNSEFRIKIIWVAALVLRTIKHKF